MNFKSKFCPALSSVSIKFCRVITTSPRLFPNVECDTIESGTRVRKEWAKVVKSGTAKKSYPNIIIVNSVTTGTWVRYAILKAYAKAYLRENPQGSATFTLFTSRPHFVYRASNTLRQTSLTFCQTILDDDLPLPAPDDLEQAYHIAGPKQFKGRIRDVFLILSDNHFKKPTGESVLSLSLVRTLCAPQRHLQPESAQHPVNFTSSSTSPRQGQQEEGQFRLYDCGGSP